MVALTAALLALIVLTGAAVRLTEAGLGCSDWPNCHEGELLPEQEDLLGLIEYGNRLLSGVVGLATLATAVLAHRLQPRRPDLVPWAWGLVAGSAAQVLLGMAVVQLELDPIAVAGHFLLSMVMLWNVVVLWLLSGSAPGTAVTPRFDPGTINHGRVMLAFISLVVLVGTMVTGTGPNSGDSRAERLGFEFTTIARTHSLLAWAFGISALTLAVRLNRSAVAALGPPNGNPSRRARLLVYASVAQGAIGYWQYLTGVPPLLVEVHVFGSVVLWVLSLLTYFALFARRGADQVDNVSVDRLPLVGSDHSDTSFASRRRPATER